MSSKRGLFLYTADWRTLYYRLLLPRLFVIPLTALDYILATGQPSNCSTIEHSLLVMYAICVSNGCAIFVVRTIAIRGSKWPLQTCLWLIWLSISTIWIYWATQVGVTQVIAQNVYQNTCQYSGDIPNWTWIIYLCVAIFDILILILTLETLFSSFEDVKKTFKSTSFIWKNHFKSSSSSSTKSNLSILFYQDTLKYFILSNTMIWFLAGWNYVHRHDQFYTALVGPMWVVFVHSSTMLPFNPHLVFLHLHSVTSG